MGTRIKVADCGEGIEARENAAFIVRACNSHAALVALRSIVTTIPQPEPGETEEANTARVHEWATYNAIALRAALNAAKS